jgi:uncharacterized protein (DUF58 family)
MLPTSIGNDPRGAKSVVRDGSKPPPLPRTVPPPLPQNAQSRRASAFHSRFLNPDELERFDNLLVFASTIVEGWLAGRHRSPHFGFSAEFVEHKAYVSGDDISTVDWQVYARTKKLYTRKFLEETDMTIHLLVDCSPSMAYLARPREMKQSRAKRVAAALAYLMLKQGDKASLSLFSDRLVDHLPPGGTRRHLFQLLQALEKNLVATCRTDAARALHELAAQVRKRGRLVVVSDFLGVDVPAMFDALSVFVHRGFEVMLMQVLDPDELSLPDVDLARFRDSETGQEVQVEPEEIRAAYEREMQGLMGALDTQSVRRRISFSMHHVGSPYIAAIESYINFRRR